LYQIKITQLVLVQIHKTTHTQRIVINKRTLIKQAHLLAKSVSVLGAGELLIIDDTPRYEFKCCVFPVCIYKNTESYFFLRLCLINIYLGKMDSLNRQG